VCNKEGFWSSKFVDKKIEKGSMRVGCKAEVNVKFDTKGNYWCYDIVSLLHNHKLNPESRMVCFMRSHKNMEDQIKNLMNLMTRAGVQHQAQMMSHPVLRLNRMLIICACRNQVSAHTVQKWIQNNQCHNI
jgi:hypothetical protein